MLDLAYADDCLMIRVPTPPVARYRRRGSEHPYRPEGLREMLWHAPAPSVDGKAVLVIIHVFAKEKDPRRVPDFDNFDLKSYIDEVTLMVGGDHPYGMVLVHAAEPEGELEPDTYMILAAEPEIIDVKCYRKMLKNAFCG